MAEKRGCCASFFCCTGGAGKVGYGAEVPVQVRAPYAPAGGDDDLDEQALRLVFDKFDKNKDGVIDREELVDLLMQHLNLPKPPTPLQVARVMNRVDLDGDGLIQFDEFKQLIKNRSAANKHLEAFKKLDINNDGYITIDELSHRMKDADPNCTDEEIEAIFNSMDTSEFLYIASLLPSVCFYSRS